MPTRLDSSILGALRCFECAGRLLSFTKTAAALSLTQSAVSQQIRQLEERLGYPLFVRRPRGLALTPKGAALHEVVTGAFAEINRVLERLDEPQTVVLNVSCIPSFALQWLMPRLADFHRHRPDISVRLKAEVGAVAPYALDMGSVDVAIRYLPPEEFPPNATPLLDEYLVAVATPEYLRRHPPTLDRTWFESVRVLHDIEPWESAPEFIEWQTWFRNVLPSRDGFVGGSACNFHLSSLAVSAALNHQGVTLGRLALIYDELRSGRLVDIFGYRVPAPARYVLIRRNNDSEPHVGAFVDWLTEACVRFDEERRMRDAAQ